MVMRGRRSGSFDSTDHLGGEAGELVHLLLHGDALDDVAELDLAAHLREDRVGEGVPLEQSRSPGFT